MLSFATTHAVTGCLLNADADAAISGFHSPPVLLLLHDWPVAPAGPTRQRQLRALAFTVHPHDVAQHRQGIPGVLTDLAATLTAAAHPSAIRLDPGLAVVAESVVHTMPGSRLLAWAVLYHDIHTDPEAVTITDVRRVDAVDVDGRVYQLTRLRGEAHAVVLIDDQPDPDDTPATYRGLTALLTASQRLARHTRHGTHP